MAKLWKAISRFFHVGHKKTVGQGRSRQQRISLSTQPKNDSRVQRDVFELAVELAALKQEIDGADQERETLERLLLPHKKRLQILLERYQPMRGFFESRDEQDNVELVVSRIERMESGVEEIDLRINAKRETIERLRNAHDGIIRQIMKRTQMRVNNMLEWDEQSLIDEAMVLPESLDIFEDQAVEIEDDMQAEQPSQDYGDCGDAVSFTSEDAEEQETIELMKRLGSLKQQRTELREEPTNGALVAGEIQALTEQINQLGDEIAIRGAPCVEGSIIFQDAHDKVEVADEQMSHIDPEHNMDDLSDVAIGAAHKATREYEGPGLFDGVSGIEEPGNDFLSDDERFETEAEKEERLQRLIQRVETWVVQLESSDEQPRDDADDDVLDLSFEGRDDLGSVAVGESDSVYNTATSDFAGMTLRCRIDSWNRISARQYLKLDAEAQRAHPRGIDPG